MGASWSLLSKDAVKVLIRNEKEQSEKKKKLHRSKHVGGLHILADDSVASSSRIRHHVVLETLSIANPQIL